MLYDIVLNNKYLPCGPITEEENTVLDLLLLVVLPVTYKI